MIGAGREGETAAEKSIRSGPLVEPSAVGPSIPPSHGRDAFVRGTGRGGNSGGAVDRNRRSPNHRTDRLNERGGARDVRRNCITDNPTSLTRALSRSKRREAWR